LIGCQVTTQDNIALGEVTEIVQTGAHDVLRIKGDQEILIPFVMDRFIQSVDIDNRQIIVDWELEEEDSEI